jgi:hypothetical protein
MQALAAGYARQSRASYAARLLKYACFKFLTLRLPYRLVAWLCRLRGRDLDVVVRQSVRNFSGDELLTAIRRRPSAPLTRLLARRVRRFNARALRARALRGEQLQARLAGMMLLPGEAACENACWLFAMLCQNPTDIIGALRASGFDASRNHSLADLAASGDQKNIEWLSKTVFLPCYPEIPEAEVDRLAACVTGALPPRPASQPRPIKHETVAPCA